MRKNSRFIEATPMRGDLLLSGVRRRSSAEARALSGLDDAIRRRIEETALVAFAEQELHRVNLNEFAARARTSLQTVYRYYGGKEGLLLATLDRELGELASRVAEYLRSPQDYEDYKERLRVVYGVVLDYFEKKPRVAVVLHRSVYGHSRTHDDSLREPNLIAVLTRLIAEGRSSGVLTDEVEQRVLLDFFLGVLWRFVRTSQARPPARLSPQEADASFELLWRAISKPRRAAPNPA